MKSILPVRFRPAPDIDDIERIRQILTDAVEKVGDRRGWALVDCVIRWQGARRTRRYWFDYD